MKTNRSRMWIFFLITMIMVIANVSLSAFAGILASGRCGDNAYWELTEEGVLTIRGEGTTYDYFFDYEETPWSQYNSEISKAVVEEGITGFGPGTFYDCKHLEDVQLPDSLKSIGYCVFAGCESLAQISLPSGITEIGESAFRGCSSLIEMAWPSEIPEISDSVFKNCTMLSRITLPDSVTKVGDYAFYGCSSLTEITLPEHMTELGDYAFQDCKLLPQVTVPSGVTQIGDYAFARCSGLEKVVLPEGVTEIGNVAFNGCESLSQITLPESLTQIGDSAFGDCTSLIEIALPSAMTDIGNGAFSGCKLITEITIPEHVTRIRESVFRNCASLQKINLSSGMKIIDWKSFAGCTSLKTISLPNSVTFINDSAFYGCSSLGELTIPEYVTYLGDTAFVGCSNLQNVYFTGDPCEIGENTFAGLTLTAYYPGDNDNWNEGHWQNYGGTVTWKSDTAEEPAYLASGVCGEHIVWKLTPDYTLIISGIGEMSEFGENKAPWYGYNIKIRNVEIGEGVSSVSSYAFGNCYEIRSVKLPESLKTIGTYAFKDCERLSGINLPNSLVSIGSYAFYDCMRIQEIHIPRGVSQIQEGTFFGCELLALIEFPETVVEIYPYAFTGNEKLKNIYFRGDACSIAEVAFSGIEASAYYPASNSTWNENNLIDYGGNITWKPYCISEHVSVLDEAVPATCTEDGLTEGSHCGVCGEVLVAQETTMALGHKKIIDEKVDATCTTDGLSEGLHCENCGEVLISQERIPALGHVDMLVEGRPATCTADGITDGKRCAVCEIILSEQTIIPALGHQEVPDPRVEPTCNADGWTEGSHCSVCNAIIKAQELLPATGEHIYENGICKECNKQDPKPAPVKIIGSDAHCQTGVQLYWEHMEWVDGYEIIRSDSENGPYESVWSGYDVRWTDMNIEAGHTYYYQMRANENGVWGEYGNRICVTVSNVIASGKCGDRVFWKYTIDNVLIISGEGAMYGYFSGFMGNISPWNEYINQVTKVIVEEGVTSVGEMAFYESESLTEAVLPDGLNRIGAWAFYKCKSLTEIRIPEGVTYIDFLTFGACESLKKVELPSSLTGIGQVAFGGCKSLAEVTLPEMLSSIELEGFSECESLKEITLPESMTWISSDVFKGCLNLQSIYFTGNPGIIEDTVFNGITIDAYYPAKNPNWNESHFKDYGGTVTWIPYCFGDHVVVCDKAVPATCTTNGLTEGFHCSACGEVFAAQKIIPATGEHVYEAGVCELCGLSAPILAPEVRIADSEAQGKPCLTWNPVKHALKYQIYRSNSKNGAFGLLGTTASTKYTDATAKSGVTYYYQVKATNNGSSSYSNVVSYVSGLEAPTVSIGNVESSGKIKLTWEPIDGAVKYEVYRAASKSGTYKRLITTANTSLTNTSTEAGKTYYYKVRAVGADSGVKSDFSAVKSRTCDLARPEVTISNVESSGKIKLTWKPIEGATKYEVYRATGKNGTYKRLITTTKTSLTNTSTEAGKTYYYKVRAINGTSAANSAYSAVKSRTCDLARPEVTISNVESSGKIKLTWKPIEGAEKYEVYRATSKNGTYKRLITTTKTSLTNTSTEAGKTYYYKVRAINGTSAANSAYSAVKSRTCDLARPTVTIGLTSSGKPKLTWKTVDGAVKYEVYRATSKSGTYKKLITTTKTSLTNTSVTKGKTYYYKVKAIHTKSSANSVYSSIKSVKTK